MTHLELIFKKYILIFLNLKGIKKYLNFTKSSNYMITDTGIQYITDVLT